MKERKSNKRRSYRRYEESFKAEVLKQISQGRSIKELSESLGVSESNIYSWRAQSSGKRVGQDGEIKRLKKQIKDLETDNEILKKALQIFSRSD